MRRVRAGGGAAAGVLRGRVLRLRPPRAARLVRRSRPLLPSCGAAGVAERSLRRMQQAVRRLDLQCMAHPLSPAFLPSFPSHPPQVRQPVHLESRVRQVVTNSKAVEKHKVQTGRSGGGGQGARTCRAEEWRMQAPASRCGEWQRFSRHSSRAPAATQRADNVPRHAFAPAGGRQSQTVEAAGDSPLPPGWAQTSRCCCAVCRTAAPLRAWCATARCLHAYAGTRRTPQISMNHSTEPLVCPCPVLPRAQAGARARMHRSRSSSSGRGSRPRRQATRARRWSGAGRRATPAGVISAHACMC